jgi:hypothetical protein
MLHNPSQTAFAQTQWMNNYKTLSPTDQHNPHIARPSHVAHTISVWESDESGEWKIFAQKIDNEHGLPQWTALDGVRVCTASGNQRNPRAAYDSLGHVIIVWEDYRNGDNPSIFAQCLNVSDGSVAANWSDDGVAICDLDDAADQPRIAGVYDGAYISWRDWRNSTPNFPNRDIFVSFVFSATASIPQGGGYQWVDNGLRVPFPAQQNCDQTDAELSRDYMWMATQDPQDRDGVILAYQDKRHTSATTGDTIYTVYATRFDAEGTVRWGDVRCATNDEEQLYPRIVVEGRKRGVGDSTAILVWQDAREYPATPVLYDIFGQVLNRHNGTLLGTSTGVAICDHQYTQRFPEIALYEEDEDPQISKPYLSLVTCVWEDLRENGSRGVDVYATILDGITGAHTLPSGLMGDEISTRNGNQTQARVDHFPDDANAYFVWTDANDAAGATDYADIWYQGLQVKTWVYERTYGLGLVVSPAKGEQTNPQAGGNVFVWADQRRQPILYDGLDDWNIFAETPGECVGPRDMKWRDMFADVRKIGDASDMNFVVDSAGNTLVVWEKATADPDIKDVYIQKLDVDGVPRWTNSGIKLNTMDDASHPRVCRSDSSGGAQVTWQQPDADGDPEVWYAKLSPVGAFSIKQVQVASGYTKPEIAYAWLTRENSNGTGLPHAYVAAIKPSANVADVFTSRTGAPSSWRLRQGPTFTSGLDSIKLDATDGGDCLLAGWHESTPGGTTELRVSWARISDGFMNNSPLFSLTSFGGCDIAADIAGAPPYRGGSVVYCADTGNGTVNLMAREVEFGSTFIGLQYALTSAVTGEGARNPSICYDSSVNQAGWGGMLVAWDWMYPDSLFNPPIPRHFIQTNKFKYDYPGGIGTIQWSGPIIDVNSNWSAAEPYRPDIARISKQGDDLDTLGFIVWEGLTEQCSPTRPIEVLGNWIIYDSLPPSPFVRGAQWTDPKMIGPGVGNYTQTNPMVKTSVGKTVNVFWLDNRGGFDMANGTRVWAEGSDAIFWAKEAGEQPDVVPGSLRLGESWPNPLTLRYGGISHISLDVDAESTIRLSIYDNLGREVAMVHEGALPVGRHTLRFDASMLQPGMYHYVLRGTDLLSSRGLVILR